MTLRGRAIVLCAVTALCGGALAQSRALPASAPDSVPCVQVRIGREEAGRLDCLNRALREQVRRVAPVRLDDAAAAGQSPIRLGQPTPAALRQRFGDQYGRSLTPQRPPPIAPLSPFAHVR